MKKEHRDSELYEILHFTPDISSEVRQKIDTAYEQILNQPSGKNQTLKRGKAKKHLALPVGIAAAILLAIGFLGFSNPVLAGKIPFVGRIFRLVEDKIGYPGNFSEHAVPIPAPDTEPEEPDAENAIPSRTDTTSDTTGTGTSSATDANAYSQKVGDITVTLSEASYTDMALYFSLELYSEEGFPEDFIKSKNMEGYILSYDFLYISATHTFDFPQEDAASDDGGIPHGIVDNVCPTPYLIEGTYADSHTFLGIIRIDLEEVRTILNVDSLPSEFTYSFTLLKFWDDLAQSKEVAITDPDTGQTHTIQQALRKHYEGPWSFTVPVALDHTGTQIREVMQTNADGIGISTVTKTRYEMKADIILPESADPFDYIVAITDADGNILDSQGNNAETYSVYGRNTDTVHVYVVDYITYMDECKAENVYLLPEKALFQTTVTW